MEIKGLIKDLSLEFRQSSVNSKGYQNQGYGQRRRFPSMENIKCYRCQEMGHYARDCKKPQTCSFCGNPGHFHAVCPEKPKNV